MIPSCMKEVRGHLEKDLGHKRLTESMNNIAACEHMITMITSFTVSLDQVMK